MQNQKPVYKRLLRWWLRGCKYSSLNVESIRVYIYYNVTAALYGIQIEFLHRDHTRRLLFSDVGPAQTKEILENSVVAMVNNLKREHGGYIEFEDIAKDKIAVGYRQKLNFNWQIAKGLSL